MKDIFLDTNFLISAVKYKIDIKSELDRICDFLYRIVVLKGVLLELKSLEKNPKTKTDAKLAQKIALTFHIFDSPINKKVDDILINLSNLQGAIIATNDKELKQKLKGPKIVIRNKKYFEFKQ